VSRVTVLLTTHPATWARAVNSGIGLFGLLAASLASFLVKKDLEKEIDPQMPK
jgi:hypothetical protein